MAATRRTILGVFDEPAMADQALDALQDAGFSSNQLHLVGHHSSGGFMASLKHFFTGESTTTETVAGDFADMGISGEEEQYYEREIQAGHRVLAVQVRGREQEAVEILRTHGASIYGGATQTTNTTASTSTIQPPVSVKSTQTVRTPGNDTTEAEKERALRLREERLNVNKQRVQTGEVTLHKEIETEQRTVDVPVTHEEAFIENRPVTNTRATDTTPIGEGESIRVPLSEERVNVSKDTVITGEVSIGKRAVEETQHVADTVKREKAHVEQEGDAPIHGTKSDRFHPDSIDKDIADLM